MTQGRLLPTPMHSCHAHVGTIPVKHTGHLKVPPMPSKLCSMRWQRSLAGESNIWLHSLHSWLMPSSARESDNFSDAHAGATGAKIPCTSPRTLPHQPQDTASPGTPPCTSPGTPPCTSPMMPHNIPHQSWNTLHQLQVTRHKGISDHWNSSCVGTTDTSHISALDGPALTLAVARVWV